MTTTPQHLRHRRGLTESVAAIDQACRMPRLPTIPQPDFDSVSAVREVVSLRCPLRRCSFVVKVGAH